MFKADEVQDLLTRVIQAIVDFPEKVQVTHVKGENTHVFSVNVEASDRGKVIGKKGRMVTGIRTILMGLAAKNRVRAVLDVDEQ